MDKPDGMGPQASAFWDDISHTYSLRTDEWHLLRNSWATMDELARIEAVLADAELLVRGSRGQPAPHPLLAEAARHRALLPRPLRQMDLPDVGVAQRSALSEKKSRAAHARWDRVRALREQSGGA